MELLLQATGFNWNIVNTSIILGYLSNDKVHIPVNIVIYGSNEIHIPYLKTLTKLSFKDFQKQVQEIYKNL